MDTKITAYALHKLPALTNENLESLMAERIRETANPQTVVPMLWQGLLEMDIPVEKAVRTAKLYIPRNCPQGTTFVLLNIPEGQETLDFLHRSGWIDKADEQMVCLFALEPGPGGWKSAEEEQEYLNAGYMAQRAGIYCLPGFASYVVGYGVIGSVLQKIVMADPLNVAAGVFLDADAVEESYIDEYLRKPYIDRNLRTPQGSREAAPDYMDYGVNYREIPVPVWNIARQDSTSLQKLAEYWKNAIGGEKTEQGEFPGTVYTQQTGSRFTPEGNIIQTAVTLGTYRYDEPETTAMIYRFLNRYYRYGMGPCSNMVSRKVDYSSMGVAFRRFTDSTGSAREYLVYVPEAYRDGSKKLPLMVAWHGASQSMRNMFENGLLYRLADKEGFIVVAPESTLMPMPTMLSGGKPFAYRPIWQIESAEGRERDERYADELLNRLIAEFPVDESRIYGTGHSMGCAMNFFLGTTSVGRRFAALGGTSGAMMVDCKPANDQIAPFFVTMGEVDIWSLRLTDESQLTEALDIYLIQNGLAKPENVSEVRKKKEQEQRLEGRCHHWQWTNADGIPLVRCTWVEKKHHAHTPEEMSILWEQWYKRWRIGTDGVRTYDGTPVRLAHTDNRQNRRR